MVFSSHRKASIVLKFPPVWAFVANSSGTVTALRLPGDLTWLWGDNWTWQAVIIPVFNSWTLILITIGIGSNNGMICISLANHSTGHSNALNWSSQFAMRMKKDWMDCETVWRDWMALRIGQLELKFPITASCQMRSELDASENAFMNKSNSIQNYLNELE